MRAADPLVRDATVLGIKMIAAVIRVMAGLLALLALGSAVPAASAPVTNLTGLPVFPYLSRAAMDPLTRTDTLGRWCSRFAGETAYPLDKVEAWYRTALRRASETDLTNDRQYQRYANLTGIKLALGIDYVTVFRAATGSATSIELFHCGTGR